MSREVQILARYVAIGGEELLTPIACVTSWNTQD
jgi:hypothetical protein